MAIVMQDLTKIYPGTTEPVMEHFDLTIKDGSFTVLLGSSGCGKTTALRMISGAFLLDPASEPIRIQYFRMTGRFPRLGLNGIRQPEKLP